MRAGATATTELVIRPRRGWETIDFGEIWQHRELFAFLVWRDVKIRYKQTVLGFLWAALQPLLAMAIFTVLFNRLGLGPEGTPYPLFAYSGLVVWTFFSNAITASSNSLVGNTQLISKVYFPRLFIPLGAIAALLMDLVLSLVILGGMMAYFRWTISPVAALAPVFVVGTVLAAGGIGLFLSALNVQFRDVKYATPFFVQMGLFATPIIYPLHYIPERFHALMALNPMTGIIEGFRHALLGTPVAWSLVCISMAVSLGLFVLGAFVFRRTERRFADIV